MGTIFMTVKARDWTEGDVGHIHVQLDGGECLVDWSDGKPARLNARGREWCYANHAYPGGCKSAGDEFVIGIHSESDNIVGFCADSGDMMVADVDMSSCQSIEYLYAGYLIERLDITKNPGIRTIELDGDAAALADFSGSSGLEELRISCSGITRLDLTGCSSLRKLALRLDTRLIRIAIGNGSPLGHVEMDEDTMAALESSRSGQKSLEYLTRIVERNGGEIEVTPSC